MSTRIAKPHKVAIIGASGTYGKGILARTEQLGVEAVVVTRSPHKFGNTKPTTTVVDAQLNEEKKLKESFAGCDGVISALGDDRKKRPKTHCLPHVWKAMKVCIVGASGKLGKYMVQHALDRGYDVVGVCRERSVSKLEEFQDRITIFPGATSDREVIKRAVEDCDGVLTVLVPWGVHHYSTGTAQAVLDYARPGARLVFSCGWHITRDGKNVYSPVFKAFLWIFGRLARLARVVDLNDQVEACRRVFDSDTLWTVVRGSDLEEGESHGLPVWSRHVGDPILKSNITRRVDFALFMVEALENDGLIHEAPAIVGCQAPSAVAHATPIEAQDDR